MKDSTNKDTTGRGRRTDRIAWWVIAGTAILFGKVLAKAVIRFDYFVDSYTGSVYWVSYEEGFIRRGLVGTVLAAVLGRPPGPVAMPVLAVLLLALACTALIWLTAATIRAVVHPGDRVLAAAVLIASPFTFSLIVQDRGLYDSVVIAGLVIVAALSLGSSRRSLRVLAMALVTALTVAAAELAFPFLVVLVLFSLSRLGWSRWRLVAVSAATLLPGLLLTIASFAARPSADYLATLIDRAAHAGLAVDRSRENAISALGQSITDALASSTSLSPLTFALCLVVLGGCYATSAAVLWTCTGQVRRRSAVLLVTAQGLVALALSVVGSDFRRWWGLAFVAMAATLVVLSTGRASEITTQAGPPRRGAGAFAITVLLISAGTQIFPTWPYWDPGANTNVSIEHLERTG